MYTKWSALAEIRALRVILVFDCHVNGLYIDCLVVYMLLMMLFYHQLL